MGQEIERKYLINHIEWQQLEKPTGQLYRQGYLVTDAEMTIRIRITEAAGFLTIKGRSAGLIRAEYEYQIPVIDAEELLDSFSPSVLTKVRYKILYNNKVWEVDEFLGENSGLIIAEIELTSEQETYELPIWIDQEVTGDEKYYNYNLTIRPYQSW